VVDDFVSETVFQIVVAGELIGMNFGSRLNHLAHDLFGKILFAVRNHGGLDLPATLQQSHDNSLSMVSALHPALTAQALSLGAVHVASFAADESLVYFDGCSTATELGEASSLQSEAQPMEHKPCGLLSDAKSAAYFIARHSVAAVYEHPQGGEPLVQSDRRILKNGAELYRELLVALLALPALLAFEIIVLLVFARGAFDAFGPAKRGYGVDADLLVREVPDGRLKCLWLCAFHDAKVAHSPWLVK
jgi:hypothetical protein